MKLNAIERAAMNNPLRAAHQHHREAAWFRRLAGGSLVGQHVLEVGCGRGVGVEVLLDRLAAARVTAFDLDPAMIDKAQRRLHSRRAAVALSVGDACEIQQPGGQFDAVVDFGVIHHVPDWQSAIGELARVLRPGGLVLFEEVPRHTLEAWFSVPSLCTRARTGSRPTSSRSNSLATACSSPRRRNGTSPGTPSPVPPANCSEGRRRPPAPGRVG